MTVVVRFRFRTRNRGYIPFDAAYNSTRRYEGDANLGFPSAINAARETGFLAGDEVIDGTDAEVWSNTVEFVE